MLNWSRQGTLTFNTLADIQSIIDSCAVCNEFAPKSISFRIRHADKILFNHRILMDLIWLPSWNTTDNRNKRPVLPFIDAGAKFNAARFINEQSSTAVWNTFIQCWTTKYVGKPNSMLIDQGSVFMSDEWKFACDLNGIELLATGAESHNSLGASESFHAYLRRTYNKVHR